MVFRRLIEWFQDWRRSRRLKKRMEELKKRDPFIYK
jgi:hypothetical protein